MAVTYPVLAAAVTIQTGVNDVIRANNGGADQTCTIAAGTYYATGSGGAEDLLEAVRSAIDTGIGGGVDNSSLQNLDINPANDCASVNIASDGSSVTIKWGDALTTFDGALLGFSGTSGPFTSSVSSSTNPNCIWVCDQPLLTLYDDEADGDGVVNVTQGGQQHTANFGEPDTMRTLRFDYVDFDRTRGLPTVAKGSEDPNTFDSFWRNHLHKGAAFHLGSSAVNTGTVLTNPTYDADLRYGLEQEDQKKWRPARQTGANQWGWTLRCRKVID